LEDDKGISSLPRSIVPFIFIFLLPLCSMNTSPLAGGAAESPSALPQYLCRSGGNPALQILLANVVRCPSRPGTTGLDAGHSASVFWKQRDHTTTRLAATSHFPDLCLPSLLPWGAGEGQRIMLLGVPQGGSYIHSHRSADPHEGLGSPTGIK
jgi:hypothetical protein